MIRILKKAWVPLNPTPGSFAEWVKDLIDSIDWRQDGIYVTPPGEGPKVLDPEQYRILVKMRDELNAQELKKRQQISYPAAQTSIKPTDSTIPAIQGPG